MGKLRVNQFYCVKCRKRITLSKDDICFRDVKNYKRGVVPMVTGSCGKCSTTVNKFVKVSVADKMANKYGDC